MLPSVNMSKKAGVEQCSCKKFKTVTMDTDQGTTEDSEGIAQDQDQIILAPEIMSLILDKLDFRSLKKVRLVCKSWLREAHIHMAKIGIVRFSREFVYNKIQDFSEVMDKENPALPQPFQSIDVDLRGSNEDFSQRQFLSTLSSICPPLALSRFIPGDTPLPLALPLISQCSLTLESLDLRADSWKEGNLPFRMDPKQQFPKLKCLKASVSRYATSGNGWIQFSFSSLISWIFKASPSLETYDLSWTMTAELSNRLLSEVDIRNLKTLKFRLFSSNRLTLEPYMSVPFRQLERLNIHMDMEDQLERLRVSAVVVNHCVNTLRKLGLFGFRFEEKVPEDTFPVCRHVQELSLTSLLYSSNFLCHRFPSLQALSVGTVQVKMEKCRSWSDLAPLLVLKTLEIRELAGLRKKHLGRNRDIPEAVLFFEKMPHLERLNIRPILLMQCCQLKASGDFRFTTLLTDLKQLVLDCIYRVSSSDATWDSGASLSVLTGVETFSMLKFNPSAAAKAVKELPNLKTIQFPWGGAGSRSFCPDMKSLLEVARGVEKVVITNCCAMRRVQSRRSQQLMQLFFENAPNAECGCSARNVL